MDGKAIHVGGRKERERERGKKEKQINKNVQEICTFNYMYM